MNHPLFRHPTPSRAITGLWLALVAAIWLPALATAEPHTYNLDRAHSSVTFEVRHFFNNVPGRFTRFDGKVTYDAEKPEQSNVHFTVEADSVNTDLERRDQHLKSVDFFDVETYPQISFRSTTVQKKSDDELAVTGDLTLRGKTKRMTLPIKILGVMELGPGVAKAGFETKFVIDRKEFGVSWNRVLDQGGTMLGDEVTIRVVLQMDRATAGEGKTP